MSRKPKLVPFNGSRREVIRLKTLQKHPCKEAKEMGGIMMEKKEEVRAFA